jgi:carbonic anhydrase
MTTLPTPDAAWLAMRRGNTLFVEGRPQHPRQDVDRRAELAFAQAPMAALFGCSDSRLAAEIIFDKGLGDLFVVRNAGQVVSDSVLGSLEYAVSVLHVPLIVVLAHDQCGAVRAAIDVQKPGADALPHHIAKQIAPISPAVWDSWAAAGEDGPLEIDRLDMHDVGRRHLRFAVAAILERSELISAAVQTGALGIVGANYRLAEGRVDAEVIVGDLDIVPDDPGHIGSHTDPDGTPATDAA